VSTIIGVAPAGAGRLMEMCHVMMLFYFRNFHSSISVGHRKGLEGISIWRYLVGVFS